MIIVKALVIYGLIITLVIWGMANAYNQINNAKSMGTGIYVLVPYMCTYYRNTVNP